MTWDMHFSDVKADIRTRNISGLAASSALVEVVSGLAVLWHPSLANGSYTGLLREDKVRLRS